MKDNRKYRAWDPCSGEKGIMLVNHTLKTIGETGLYLDDDLVWMEYTGIKDKNGVEIYEGDILKCPVTINKDIWGDYSLRVVSWIKNIFTWVFEDEWVWVKFEDVLCDGGDFINSNGEILIEVVGNIYENPELLKN